MPVSEAQVQKQVATYIRRTYPNVLFHSDYGSGVKLTPRQAAMQKSQQGGQSGWPDMYIALPRGDYHGMFMELKREDVKVYKKDGEVVADKHIQKQAAILEALGKKGYFTCFACGFKEAKAMIDAYIAGTPLSADDDEPDFIDATLF